MTTKPSWVTLFLKFMMLEIIPYDTKLSSLLGYKEYKLQMEAFIAFTKIKDAYADIDLEVNVINEYLNPIAETIQLNYLQQLQKNFDSKLINLPKNLKDSYNKYMIEKKYTEAIKVIELFLDIDQMDDIDINKFNVHVHSEIYQIEFDQINNSIKELLIAYNYLNEYTNTLGKNMPSGVQYLIMVIHHEIWNFMSHSAFAYTYFQTPRNYISNLHRANSHLQRAIMDVYDGLILERCNISNKYLSIRMMKLMSLGSNSKIINLSEELHQYYLNNKPTN